jgi:hypothetical protein
MLNPKKESKGRPLLIAAILAGASCGLVSWLWARSYPPVQNFGMIPVPDIRELAPLIAFLGGLIGAILGAFSIWLGRKVF